MAFELQADCYAGTWANSAYQENRLEDGDVQEALDAALAVGDFDASNPRPPRHARAARDAWNTGFESGDPVRLQPVPQRDVAQEDWSDGQPRLDRCVRSVAR